MTNNFVYLIILISTLNVFSQIDDDKVLVKFGATEITSEEFIIRYELSPQVYASMKGSENELKKELLYSIVAEKLWALEAIELGLSNSDIIKYTYNTYEEMIVRDALFKEEILNNVNLTDEYLNEAFRRNSKILQLKYLFSEKRKEIDSLYNLLNDDINFDSILINRSENDLQKEPYYVNYGQMDKDVEDILFNMNIGDITKPIEAPGGWYIFKLWKIGENLLLNSEQAEAERKKVMKIAKSTLTDSIYNEFYKNFFKDIDIKTNTEMFLLFSGEVIKILEKRKQIENISDGKEIALKTEDLYSIETNLGEENLNKIFIVTAEMELKLNEFLQFFAFEPFSINSIEKELVKRRLHSIVKNFIEHKLFSLEGYRMGLHYSDGVQQQVDMWQAYYLSNALRSKTLNDIEFTEEELKNYYHKINIDSSSTDGYDNLKEKLATEFKYELFKNKVIKKTVELAEKYSVKINDELLDKIRVTNTTSVIYRYIGFGGRILAVPMTIPNYDWVKYWLEKDIKVP